MASEWQCSRCWKIYSFGEFMALSSRWIDENKKSMGKDAVCTCGALFMQDPWRLETVVDIKYLVHTVHLQTATTVNPVNLFEDRPKNLWFETMIFDMERSEWLSFQARYGTKEEAEAGHEFTVKNINRILEEPDKHPQDIFSQFARADAYIKEMLDKSRQEYEAERKKWKH